MKENTRAQVMDGWPMTLAALLVSTIVGLYIGWQSLQQIGLPMWAELSVSAVSVVGGALLYLLLFDRGPIGGVQN